MQKRLSAILAIILICSLMPSAKAAAEPVIRVGLFYGSSALPGANLENSVGKGYRFGFFDSQNTFIQLGYTDKTKVSVVKNRNVYYNSGNYTETESSIAVGCYSVELPAKYNNGDEAKAAADSMSGNGVNAFASYNSGVFTVRLNSYLSSSDASSAASNLGGAAVTGSKYCVSVVETGTSNILFQFDLGDNRGFGIMPSLGEAERPVTWCKGYTYNGGFEYRRMDGNNITVINILSSAQEYLKGVVPWEMSGNWHIEALKAQAVCARSYMYNSMGRHGGSGFDLCNEPHCQAYGGTKTATANSDAAVDQTAGQYVMYNGSVCNTFYYSSNGGASENSENVWFETIPYLRGVYDSYEDLNTSTNGRWQYTVTNAQLTEILRAKGHANSGIVSMTVQYTAVGNVYSITFTDSSGKPFVFTKSNAKTILNSSAYGVAIHSQRFSINSGQTLSLVGADGTTVRSDLQNITILGANGQTTTASASTSIMSSGGTISSVPQGSNDGTYIIQGTGWGHNVGMSQNGAKAMAAQGFTYEDIVKFYFTGVYVGTLE